MGTEKDRLIEEEERGWRSIGRHLVCDSCVGEDYLYQYIADHGRPGLCAYCESDRDDDDPKPKCIPVDGLMELIGQAVKRDFTDPDSAGMPWDSEERNYAFPGSVFGTRELLTDEIGLEADEDLLEDIVSALGERDWCRKRFSSVSRGEGLHFGWQNFIEKVKYETRYLFSLPHLVRETETTGQHEIPVHEMLDTVAEIVEQSSLLRNLSPGEVLYRVRVADKGVVCCKPSDLGPPPREHAIQPNRMSPAGIVMFYGAFDRETAIAETFQPLRAGAVDKDVWLATFQVAREIRVLDLTRLPPVRSFFQPNLGDEREEIQFLRSFVSDLVEPIERDGHEHIDYVPTQIVTEYFRHRFRTLENHRAEGILYPSSKRGGGVACVLFIDASHCGVETGSWRQPEQALSLLSDRTEHISGADLVEKAAKAAKDSSHSLFVRR